MNTTGVYRIKNKVNGKIYVGQSVNVEKRILDHKWFLREGDHSNPYLQNAWDKYGEDNFDFQLIAKCKKGDLCFVEQYWMDKLKAYEKGYNLIPRADRNEMSEEHRYKCGNGNRGRKQPKEEKQKRSESLKEYYENNEHWMKGNTHSKEKRNKISESVKEWHRNNETPAKNYEFTEGELEKISERTSEGLKKREYTKEDIERSKKNLPNESKGEKNGFSKLNEQAVKAIKWSLNKGKTQKVIADAYGVSKSTIGMIARGKTWTHVEVPEVA